MRYAIDENVLIVANGDKTPQANDACRAKAIDWLVKIKESKITLLDTEGKVLAKYREYCDMKGQPGTGDMFLRFLHENQANTQSVETISLQDDATREYIEFPDDEELSTFDRSDRIFVGLVIGSDKAARVLNAVDSDYSHHATALSKHSVKVEELCPDCLKPSEG